MASDRTQSAGSNGIRQVLVDQAKQFLATLPDKKTAKIALPR